MELQITVPGKKTKKKLEVSDIVFGCAFNEPLIHQVVCSYLAAGRSGNAAQKTRSEVSGGGKKPWRQKGTGRARAGTSRSPLWRKGGVIFAAKKRDYTQKVNKKMYRQAIRSMLSELARQNRIHVVESLTVEAPKTKLLVEQLKALEIDNALIITADVDGNLFLAGNNIPNVEVRDVTGLDPVALINYDNLIVTQAAIKQIEEMLA